MIALGPLFLTVTIFATSFAFASQHIERTCISEAGDGPTAFVSAKAVLDDVTGLTVALFPYTTYTKLEYCIEALSGDFKLPVFPTSINDLSDSMKCYSNLNSGAYYLVQQYVNTKTGLVVALNMKNEFDSYEACKSNLLTI